MLLTHTPVQSNAIPLFGSQVPAGFPSPATDYIEDRIDLNDLLIPRPSSTFMVKVVGDSMKDASMPSGSILIVDRSITPSNNTIIVAEVSGEFTVKRYTSNAGQITLHPANKKYKPLTITEDMNFRVWGTVTSIIIRSKQFDNIIHHAH